MAAGWSFLIFRKIGDKGFSGQHEGSDGSRVLQGSARYLGRIDYAGLYQVLELIALSVVAIVEKVLNWFPGLASKDGCREAARKPPEAPGWP